MTSLAICNWPGREPATGKDGQRLPILLLLSVCLHGLLLAYAEKPSADFFAPAEPPLLIRLRPPPQRIAPPMPDATPPTPAKPARPATGGPQAPQRPLLPSPEPTTTAPRHPENAASEKPSPAPDNLSERSKAWVRAMQPANDSLVRRAPIPAFLQSAPAQAANGPRTEKLSDTLVRVTLPDGRSYCLQAPPQIIQNGLPTPALALPGNCP